MLTRRPILKAIGALPAALAFALPGAAFSQARPYPSKPITLVVPYGAGNTADVLGRLVAQKLGTALGQQVIVDNRPGAGGVSATNLVASAAPDGYTLLMLGAAAAITQALFKPAPYDVLKSFTPISTLTTTDVLILVRKDSKLRTLNDFIRQSKERGDGLMVGISQLGTTQHLSAELFKLNTKTGYTIVPFKTASTLTTALLGGEVDVAFELITPAMSLLQSGQLRALAIGNAKRSELLPDVPTVVESDVPYFEVMAWGMVVAPAKTPDAIVQRLNLEIQKILAQPEVMQRFKESGSRAHGESVEQARTFLTSEIAKWDRVVKETKVSIK